jgi:hypothetical protein
MYYVISLLAGLLLIGCGVAFVWLTQNTVKRHFDQEKQKLIASQAAGQLSAEWKGVDIEKLELSQLSMKVPSDLSLRLDIADFLSAFWYVLVPLTLVVCFGIAFLMSR